MSRITKSMPSFQGVAVGAKAIANLPVGLTYDALFIKHQRSGTNATEAQMKAELGDIRLLVNATPILELSSTQLLDLYKYYGYTVNDGMIPLIFSRPWARTPQGEDALALGTQDVDTLTLEVNIDGSATSPTLELFAMQSAPRPLGQHVSMKRFDRSIGGAGIFEEANLPRGNYGLSALHIGSGSVTDAELLANERQVWNAPSDIAEQADELTGKVWQSGYFHINTANTDRIGDVLPMNLEDLRLKLTFSGSANFPIIQERIDTFSRR